MDNPAANNKADNGQRNTTENVMVFEGLIDDHWDNVANWTCNGGTATGLPTAPDNVTIKKDTKLTIADGASLNSNVHITI